MGKWQSYWRNRGHQTKRRVEHFRCFDCSQYYDKREYPLEEGETTRFDGWHLTLFSSHVLVAFSNQDKEYHYTIPVVSTNCNYGGHRHWFLCPMPSCNRRSKKLYLYSARLFLCRKCLNLAYTTQNQSEADRIIDKKWHLIRKYGGDSEWNIKKPKGMHQKTFNRIRKEIERLHGLSMQKIAQMFGGFLEM